jgi:hypothetical protein
MVLHRPPHDPSRMDVQDKSEVEKAFQGVNVGDVDGLITKGRFCFTRYEKLIMLSYSRVGWSHPAVHDRQPLQLGEARGGRPSPQAGLRGLRQEASG